MVKYIVYITVNTINNKIYIGVHKTETDKFDGYIGDGINIFNPSSIKNPKTHFHYAVKKYGFDAFRRYTLAEVDTEEKALVLENILVNRMFVDRNDTYNMIEGGGTINKREIPIYKFSLDGKLLEKYNSIKEAALLNKMSDSNIIQAYKFKKSFNNFFWSTEDSINIYEYKLVTQYRTIYCFDLNCNLVKTYSSLSEAGLDYDTSPEAIKNAINKMTKVNHHYFSYNSEFNLMLDVNRIIYRYELNGNFVDCKSIKEYALELNLDVKKLFKASNAGLTLAKYQWNIENPIKMRDLSSRLGIGSPKKVGRYDLEGNLLEVFDTITKCKETYTNVRRVLNGQLPTTKGFVFKYLEQ